jgi:Pentapeptide repeats (8 copies)
MFQALAQFSLVFITLSFCCMDTNAFSTNSRSTLYASTTHKLYLERNKNTYVTSEPSHSILPLKVPPIDVGRVSKAYKKKSWLGVIAGRTKILAPSLLAFTIALSVSAADANRNLSGQDWSNGNYEKQDFSGVIAAGTNFQKSNLQGCNFNSAILVNADLSGADISGASFKDTVLDGAILKNVNAVKTIFSASILDVGSLENADLTDSLWPSKLQIMICDMPTLIGTSSSGVGTRDSILCSL